VFICVPLALVLALAGSVPGRAADQVAGATQPAKVDYSAAIDRFAQIVDAELKRGILSGTSVALVDDQQIVCARGFGYADRQRRIPAGPRSVYRAGSISKLFTAIAAMQLAEQGQLDIDRPVALYDPAFHVVVPFDDAQPITLRQLMCHRAGMFRESPVGGYFDPSQPTVAATLRSIAPCVLVYRPNTHTKYSNIGATVTGDVVGRVSNMPFVEYQQQHLLQPLGMKDSAFLMNEGIRQRLAPGRMWVADGQGGFRQTEAPLFELGTIPAGNLYTTAEDLARFLMFLLAEGRSGSRQLLKPETLQAMFTVQLTKEETGFGLGFHVGKSHDHKLVGHMGEVYGHTSSMAVLPQEKIGVVVLANEDIAAGPVRKLSDAALELMLEAKLGEKPKPQPAPFAVAPAELAKLAGDYESQSYWARIEVHQGTARLNVSGQPLTLTPIEADKFDADGRFAHKASVVFRRGDLGEVTGFSTLEQEFRRVDRGATGQVPDQWQGYLGSYGPEFIPLVISVKHGHLYAMTENVVDYRLTPLCRNVFKMPPGMYVDEQLVFQAGPDGKVHSAILANMVLHRRSP
jgi:CubicO group peptidase (beta-lactamase class C family)